MFEALTTLFHRNYSGYCIFILNLSSSFGTVAKVWALLLAVLAQYCHTSFHGYEHVILYSARLLPDRNSRFDLGERGHYLIDRFKYDNLILDYELLYSTLCLGCATAKGATQICLKERPNGSSNTP
jgi:hypothetical protein